MPLPPTNIADRLWKEVAEVEGHWLWGGACINGYGVINTGRHGRTMLVHRLSWMLSRGDPGVLHVLHHCDTPNCVNPEHLFLGTQADNNRDMDSKGRGRRHFSRNRKLTPEQVAEILVSPESSYALAKRYPIGDSTIRRLRREGGYKQSLNPWEARVK